MDTPGKKRLNTLSTWIQALEHLPRPFVSSLVFFLFLDVLIFFFIDLPIMGLTIERVQSLHPGIRILVLFLLVLLAGNLIPLLLILLAYNLAVLVNLKRFNRSSPMKWLEKEMQAYQAGKQREDEEHAPEPHRKQTSVGDEQKIGIILAGGGAKGAYQAGALKAIYEYLEKTRRLQDVTMIAGTSIGAWNALFWLADLVKPVESDGAGKVSFHQFWWEHLDIPSMAMPSFYFPLRRNSLASTEPWRQQFDTIFRTQAETRSALTHTNMRFYFTKANVMSGNLDVTTNNPRAEHGIPDRQINTLLPGESQKDELFVRSVIPKERCTYCNPKDPKQYLQNLKDGVFASMTFPPVVPQQKDGKNVYEDGGAIDNLPVYFGSAIEDCDFLFILPLNADFAEKSQGWSRISLTARLFRVLNIRQGALEQHALKRIRLYNELASARQAAWQLDEKQRRPHMTDWELSKEYRRNYRNLLPINVFAICPQNLVVDTLHFWKSQEAKQAFEIMYRATAKMLSETDPLRGLPDSGSNRAYGKIDIYKVNVNGPADIERVSLEETPI